MALAVVTQSSHSLSLLTHGDSSARHTVGQSQRSPREFARLSTLQRHGTFQISKKNRFSSRTRISLSAQIFAHLTEPSFCDWAPLVPPHRRQTHVLFNPKPPIHRHTTGAAADGDGNLLPHSAEKESESLSPKCPRRAPSVAELLYCLRTPKTAKP